MRGILFIFGGLLIVGALVFFIYKNYANPFKLMFYTETVKGKDFDTVIKELESSLNSKGLKFIRALPLSKALKSRGVENFPNYSMVLACDVEGKKELLLKVPFLSNLIPCSLAVYDSKEGGVAITALKETLFIHQYKARLSEEDIKLIKDTYTKLREVIKGVAQ
jgi:uncharacterized protein (DUF302 family)